MFEQNRNAARAELMTVGGVVLGWYRQTLDGPFSAVSKPIFATKASFCSIFRDLQEHHLLASKFLLFLKVGQKIEKSSEFFKNFQRFQKFSKLLLKF